MPWTAACTRHRRSITYAVVHRHTYLFYAGPVRIPERCDYESGCKRRARWEVYWEEGKERTRKALLDDMFNPTKFRGFPWEDVRRS